MNMHTRTYPSDEVRINSAGMMRCCIDTLAGWCDQWFENPRPLPVNTVIRCLYAPDDNTHTWILDSTGTFRWNRSE